MSSTEIVKMLNADLSNELGLILRCNMLSQTAENLKMPAEAAIFQQAVREEMRHAECLTERIVHLGGSPVKVPHPFAYHKSDSFWQMLEDTISRKRQIQGQYRAHICKCITSVDPVTQLTLEVIIADEERQIYLWRSILQAESERL